MVVAVGKHSLSTVHYDRRHWYQPFTCPVAPRCVRMTLTSESKVNAITMCTCMRMFFSPPSKKSKIALSLSLSRSLSAGIEKWHKRACVRKKTLLYILWYCKTNLFKALTNPYKFLGSTNIKNHYIKIIYQWDHVYKIHLDSYHDEQLTKTC